MQASSPQIRVDYRDRSDTERPRKRVATIAAAVAAGLMGTFVMLQLRPAVPAQTAPTPADEQSTTPLAEAPADPNPSTAAAGTTIALTAAPVTSGLSFDSIDVVVRRNDTLDQIFRRLRLSITDLATIRDLPGIRQTLDALRPGDQIKVTHADGELQGLVRQINDTQTLAVTRAPAGFSATIIENPVETQITRKRVRIASSLFEAANAAGVSDQTALALANIFGWDIDFVLDIRSGDEFTVVYQEIWQDGAYRRDGAVLAAEFVNNGRSFRAVRYELPSGRAEYFTPDGHSMHKAFLRAPLDFTRISSRFNPNRRHPILNRIRAHNGVDYAAPSGTPVRAAGDGRVGFKGDKGGYGHVVVLEHGAGISTLYGHLSRFAKGMSAGKRVSQGEVIAYVGRTGLATGPHLHYEYRINGAHRNPQTVPLPDAEPIAKELRADFTAHAAPLLTELDQIKSGPLLADR